MSALNGVLQLRARGEAWRLRGVHIHALAGGGIHARAGVAMRDGELPEAGDGDLLATGKAILDRSDCRGQRLTGLALAEAGTFGDLLDELLLVHGSLPWIDDRARET